MRLAAFVVLAGGGDGPAFGPVQGLSGCPNNPRISPSRPGTDTWLCSMPQVKKRSTTMQWHLHLLTFKLPFDEEVREFAPEVHPPGGRSAKALPIRDCPVPLEDQHCPVWPLGREVVAETTHVIVRGRHTLDGPLKRRDFP